MYAKLYVLWSGCSAMSRTFVKVKKDKNDILAKLILVRFIIYVNQPLCYIWLDTPIRLLEFC